MWRRIGWCSVPFDLNLIEIGGVVMNDENLQEELRKLKEHFKNKLGYELNLEFPHTLQEKIQWIKIYGKLERFAKYTDKFEVYSFIKERIGTKYLIPLLGVYDDVDDIDFEALPTSFVMKATHGSRWNIIVEDKSKIDWNASKEQMRTWLNSSWYQISKERNYKDLQSRVIIQPHLKVLYGKFKEYQFHCFHGIPKFFRITGIGNYDMKGNPLFGSPHYPLINKPRRFDEMKSIVYKLCKDFAYVRVDLFYTVQGIYFCELTFAHGGGFLPTPKDFGSRIGQWLDLTRYL